MMMGTNRPNEKDNPSAYTYPLVQTSNGYESSAPYGHAAQHVISREGNGAGGHLVPIPNIPVPNARTWENMYPMNQSYARVVPAIGGNPTADFSRFTMSNSFRSPQINHNYDTTNTNHSGVTLLPEWDRRGIRQSINQDCKAISMDAMDGAAGVRNFQSPWPKQNPMIARNLARDGQMSRQDGVTKLGYVGRLEANGGSVSSPLLFHPKDRGPVHTRNNAMLNTSQYGVQGKVEGRFPSLGIGGNEEGISKSHLRSREIAFKPRDAAPPELNMACFQKTVGQSLDARTATGFSDQLCDLERGTSITPNNGPGSNPYPISPTPRNDIQRDTFMHGDSNSKFLGNRNLGYGDLDFYRVGNQAAVSGTPGGSYAWFSSQQNDLNGLTPESAKPSWITSHTSSGQLQNVNSETANSLASEFSVSYPSSGLRSSSTPQNYAEQRLLSKNSIATEGFGGSMFPQTCQVAQNSGAQVATYAPFPKRLGIEFIGGGGLSKGISMQTTSTGKIRQPPEKGSTHFPDIRRQPSVIGQSQGAFIQVSKDPRRTVSNNASAIACLSQSSDIHRRPYLKRTAVAPPPASHGAQRQKITQPNVHPSRPIQSHIKPTIPVTNALIRPSIPVLSQIKPTTPLTTAHFHPSIPYPSHFKPHSPAMTAPIAWQDPEGAPQMSGHKCLLCKRDLSLTSEGTVCQPAAPPAVAVLPCGHTFHDRCLHNITPQDHSKDPPCIPCAIGEN